MRPHERVDEVMHASFDLPEGGRSFATRYGPVHISGIEEGTDENGVSWVEVFTPGPGETHYRIFNPPTLAEDPNGPIAIGTKRFREDPLAAVAEAIGRHGGALNTKKGRRR